MKLTVRIIITCLTIILLCVPVARGHQGHVHKVLILHSYHHGFQWTDDIMNGIDSVFKQSGAEIQMFVEYMDTKRHDPEKFFPLLYELYKSRYQDEQIDLIIISDNNALEFLLSYRDELFHDVPAVFCGVNNFSDAMTAGHQGITGVAERMDIKETVYLARRLNPDVRQIIIVNDRTPTGIQNQLTLEKEIVELKGDIEFVHFLDLTFEELQEKLGALPVYSAVLLFTFHLDREGRRLEHEEFVPAVGGSASVPTYSMWKQYLGYEITGGVMLDGSTQGSHAAEIALKILHGELPEDIPVRDKSINRVVLDYTQLKRFGIDDSRIPPDAAIFNKPFSFYENYKERIWTIGGGVLTVFLFILVAVRIRAQRQLERANMQLRREIQERRQIEESLRSSEERYHSLISHIPSVTWIANAAGRTTFISPNVEIVCGYTPEQIYESGEDAWFGRIHPEDAEGVRTAFQKLLGKNEAFDVTYRIKGKDGQWIWVHDMAVSTFESEKGIHAYGVFSDVTEKKNIESRLSQETRLREVLLDNLPCIAMILKKGTREIVASNQVAKEAGAVAGKTCYETCTQRSVPCSFCLAPDVWAQDTPMHLEVEYRGKWYERYWLPFSDELYVHYIFDITDRKITEKNLKKSTDMISHIRDAQGLYISSGDNRVVFEDLLNTLVSMTESEYGFLDEVLENGKGTWYKRSLALSNIAWDEGSRRLYEDLKKSNFEFHNLYNLSGEPVRSGRLVISNDCAHDPRSGGLPDGHPPVHAFLGIPMFYGGELIGVAGVANRKGGYTEEIAVSLEPFINTCASIISAIRAKRSEREYLEKIRASLEEKEVLLREVHHRVKNNFQIINSLLRLQADNIQGRDMRPVFVDIENRIRSMAMVHEMLYSEGDLTRVDIRSYINVLLQGLCRSYRVTSENVKIRVKIKGVKLGVDAAVPFGLVVNELVSNAMKHAFPGGIKGEIVISLERTDGENRYELVVGDNGVGLPEGLDIRKSGTLGLRLVVNVVEKQVGGRLEVRRGMGTEFRIRFSEARERDDERREKGSGTDWAGNKYVQDCRGKQESMTTRKHGSSKTRKFRKSANENR